MVCGVWIALQSFLGFPILIDEILYAVLGVSILILGFLLYREHMARVAHIPDTFAEYKPDARDVDIDISNSSHDASSA